jgi:hypothetical protein
MVIVRPIIRVHVILMVGVVTIVRYQHVQLVVWKVYVQHHIHVRVMMDGVVHHVVVDHVLVNIFSLSALKPTCPWVYSFELVRCVIN